MTKQEVAVLLRVTPRTVENYALRGGLPYLKIGRSVRFSRAAVEAWMRPHEAPAAETPCA